MKTWHYNIIFTVLGFLIAAILGTSAAYDLVINSVFSLIQIIVYFLFIPILIFTLISSIATIKKQIGLATSTILWSLLWNLMITLVLCLLAGLIYNIFKPTFNTSFQATTEMVSTINFTKSIYVLPVIIIVSIFIGNAIKPDEERYYPAFAILNSFSEVMYKISENLFKYSWFAVLFFAGFFFKSYLSNGMFSEFLNMTVFLLVITLLVSFAVIPLVLACFTKFKANPFLPVLRLLGSSITAFFANDPLYVYPQLYFNTRNNLGVPKKIVSTTMPLSLFISKGGTAMLSTLLCLIFLSASGTEIDSTTISIVVSSCTLLSFVCGLRLKNEMLFICLTTFTFSNFSLDQETQLQLLYTIPLLTGFGYFLDTIISGLTAFVAGFKSAQNIKVRKVIVK